MFLPFSAFSATSAVRSSVVVLKPRGSETDNSYMTKARGGLTPYLAAALRLGGPGCESAVLAREERAILRGAPRGDISLVRSSPGGNEGPEPRPLVLRLVRRAAGSPPRSM